MAVHTAAEGTVKVGSNAIGSIRSMSLEASAETIDATTITDAAKVNLAGTKSYSGSVDCYWDEADTNGQLVLIEAASVTLEFGFEGSTTGDYTYTLAAVVSGVSISSAVDGMVEASFSFTGTGALTRGTV
tara:strand:+ start:372 stop:761 length:390 start_codon:yes stop_codon:yes gene_type:complete